LLVGQSDDARVPEGRPASEFQSEATEHLAGDADQRDVAQPDDL